MTFSLLPYSPAHRTVTFALSTRILVMASTEQKEGVAKKSRHYSVLFVSLVPRLSLNIRKGGGEERESLANFIVTFRSGCPLFFRTVNKVLTHIHRHRLARLYICSANALRMRGFTPCSHSHVVVVTTTEPESAERLPYAKFARLSLPSERVWVRD